MDRSDIRFRKNCQFYHTKITKLLKKGEFGQAKELLDKVGTALTQWENSLRSAQFKVNLLRNIYADLLKNERRASYKLDRRQGDDSEK
jgi:hypothetical protein